MYLEASHAIHTKEQYICASQLIPAAHQTETLAWVTGVTGTPLPQVPRWHHLPTFCQTTINLKTTVQVFIGHFTLHRQSLI